jgi:hypothetical protein
MKAHDPEMVLGEKKSKKVESPNFGDFLKF